MALLNAGDKISPAFVAEQVRIYDEQYLAALISAQVPEWIPIVAKTMTVSSPLVRFPVSLVSGEFQETKADNRDVEWGSRYVDLAVAEYDFGYEVKAEDLVSPIMQEQWSRAPGDIVLREQRLKARLVASTLEANPVGQDGVTLFNDSHPLDNGTTFDNLQASALDPTNVSAVLAEKTLGEQQIKDENGLVYGVEFDTIMMQPAKATALRYLLQQNFIPSTAGTATVSNPLFGASLRIVGNPFLTGNFAYFIASSMTAGMPPLALVEYDPGAPLRLRQFGYESDHFKSTGRLKNSHHVWMGCGALFPQAIRRVALT